MSRQGFRISAALCILLGLTAVTATARPPLPVAFETHQGPADPQVRFTARSQGTSLALLDDGGAVLSRHGADGTRQAVRILLDGARPCPTVEGEGERGAASYYLGNDPARWRTGIPTWDRVRYTSVWPGIDLVYYAKQGQFEHDFVVAPGADPGAITLRFEGLETKAGETDMTVDGDGNLRLAAGELVLQAPQIYQETGGTRQPVAGHYAPAGPGRVRIAVEAYDTEKPLVIDPVIVYSSFIGGSAGDFIEEVAVDGAGNTYITGRTLSNDFPLVNPAVSTLLPFYDIFVAKVSADGLHLIYSTYLGSSDNDQPTGIAVDAAGNTYLSGWVFETDFPVLNAIQPTLGGLADVFVTKLSPAGALLYSTYLGGSSFEVASSWPWGSNIKVKPDGTAYVTGGSFSADFPQVHAIQAGLAPNSGCLFLGLEDYPCPCADLFLTVISPAGNQILYSTLWGGPDADAAGAIDIDPSGAAYLLGNTGSPGFPLVNPFQAQLKGDGDLFVMKIRPDGTPPVYVTLLGGSGGDGAWDLRVDAEGSAYVLAQSTSTDLPVKNALQATNAGGSGDWYLAKINPRGTGLDYATYFGGPGFDVAQSMGLDALGNVVMTGYSLYDPPFPTLRPMSSVKQNDGFVAKIHATGPTLLYSTPIGGGGGSGIDLDSRGDVHVGGGTNNSGGLQFDVPPNTGPFPILHAFQPVYGGGGDGYVMKIADGFATLATPSRIPAQPGGTVTVPVRFTPGGFDIAFTTFSIDYDQTCLTFDPTDANADGIPDAITFTLPAGFGKSATFNAADPSGEIDISVFDPSPPFTLLPLSELARITFHVKPTCGAAAVSTLARVGFSSTPAVSFGDVTGHSSPGISLDGSVQVWGGLHGDCNGDSAVNAGDLGASVLEVFDGDGSFWLDAPLATFAGSPAGCDANGDNVIDAGDLSCTNLLIFQGPGACASASLATSQAPSLSVSLDPRTAVRGSIPALLQLQRGTSSVNSVVFSLIIPEELVFDPTDANGDGTPDAVSFSLPPGFSGSARWSPINRAGQLALLVMDTSGNHVPLPLSSTIAVITLKTTPSMSRTTALHFGTAPAASFGTTQGSSTPGSTQ